MSWSRRLHRDIRRGLGNAHRYILWNLGLWRLVDIRTLWLVAVSQFVIVITICVAISAAIAVASSPPPPPPPTFCPCLANLDKYNVEYNADGTLRAVVTGKLYKYPTKQRTRFAVGASDPVLFFLRGPHPRESLSVGQGPA